MECCHPVYPREDPGSRDGGVFLLLHYASLFAGTNISAEQDFSRLRVLLASKLAPLCLIRSGTQLLREGVGVRHPVLRGEPPSLGPGTTRVLLGYYFMITFNRLLTTLHSWD